MDAFLLYIDDWLGSTNIALMDAYEERGYLRLLLHAAKQPDCGLPNDPEFLAKLSKLGARWERGSGERLMRCFFEKDGRIFNQRLLDVYHDYLDRKDRKRKAAESSWNKRRATSAIESANESCNADTMHMQNGCNAYAEPMLPIPTPIPNINTPPTPSDTEGDLFGSPKPKRKKAPSVMTQWQRETFAEHMRLYPRTDCQEREVANIWRRRIVDEKIHAFIVSRRELLLGNVPQFPLGPAKWLDAQLSLYDAGITLPLQPTALAVYRPQMP